MQGNSRDRKVGISRTLFYAGAIIIGSVVVAIAAASLAKALGPEAPRSRNGLLDLRGWDFASSGPIELGGRWRFLNDQLVGLADFDSGSRPSIPTREVPDIRPFLTKGAFFGTGSGTYRLRVLLPPSASGLAIRYSDVRTAFELEVNGVLAARAGKPSLEPGLDEPAFRPGIVRVDAVDGQLDIVVRVSNHEYRWGGIARPFALGEESRMVASKRTEDMILFIVLGTLLGIAANSLFIFAFRRREKAYLYFSVFAATVALRALVANDAVITVMFPSIDFGLLVRLQYASLVLLLPSGALFFAHFFPGDIGRKELIGLVAPGLAFSLFQAFAPLLLVTWSFLLFAPILFASIVWGFAALCLRPALRRRPGRDRKSVV